MRTSQLTQDTPGLSSTIVAASIQQRTLRVVVASQIFGGTGLAAGVTVGGLLAKDMIGGSGAAGVPSALFTLGSAATAFLVGRVTARQGRRIGLSFGFAAGAIGASGVVAAAVTDNIALLFISFLVYGAGTATNLQARYAGTDLAEPERRATAVSIAMVSTTFGAVAGPNLVDPMGSFAASVGVPPLAGPFILAGAAYAIAGLVLFALLRPDPFLVSQQFALAEPVSPKLTTDPGHSGTSGITTSAYLGAAIMVITQMTMVAIMTMTPIHMRDHGHGVSRVGLVIGFHIGAMYLPSLITGRLVDRVGPIPMAIAAAVTMVLAGISAAVAPAGALFGLIVALMLLGLGWNMGLIAGTALVIDSTTPANRPKVQGTSDVAIALAGAGAGAMSGVVMASSSYGVLALTGGGVSLAIIPIAWMLQGESSRLSPHPS